MPAKFLKKHYIVFMILELNALTFCRYARAEGLFLFENI
jgi:hypothetical protein